MSKMSELSMVIDEMIICGEGILKAVQDLTTCGEGMIIAAKKLKDMFSTGNLPEPKAVTMARERSLPVKEEHSEEKNTLKKTCTVSYLVNLQVVMAKKLKPYLQNMVLTSLVH
ncbi:hypothetical protein [Clostridium sp.]|uniref:hypothetical protein n=1 Tax=Clostridium sp. TaxID=1506 RepID=UPI00321783F5